MPGPPVWMLPAGGWQPPPVLTRFRCNSTPAYAVSGVGRGRRVCRFRAGTAGYLPQ